MEYKPADADREQAVRTVTGNISTGGVYFEMDILGSMMEPEVGSTLDIDLTVPPGDGYFPYQGRVTSVAEVVRSGQPEEESQGGEQHVRRRIGVAARFCDDLKLTF